MAQILIWLISVLDFASAPVDYLAKLMELKTELELVLVLELVLELKTE